MNGFCHLPVITTFDAPCASAARRTHIPTGPVPGMKTQSPTVTFARPQECNPTDNGSIKAASAKLIESGILQMEGESKLHKYACTVVYERFLLK